MNNFDTYLRKQGFYEVTTRTAPRNLSSFFEWIDQQNIQPKHIGYTDLLSFIDYCKAKGNTASTINVKLRYIRYYFDYLKENREVKTNPATDLHVQKDRQKIIQPLSEEQLNNLYDSYEETIPHHTRNKAITGLLIFQGLTTQETGKLLPEDVELTEGRVHIPETAKTNGRVLNLHPKQILQLNNYIETTRNELMKERNTRTEKLFFSKSEVNDLHNVFANLQKQLKAIEPKLNNLQHIRSSVIMNWLNHEGIRQVQYKAGHRYVSSTERYLENNLQSLKDELGKFHPLG